MSRDKAIKAVRTAQRSHRVSLLPLGGRTPVGCSCGWRGADERQHLAEVYADAAAPHLTADLVAEVARNEHRLRSLAEDMGLGPVGERDLGDLFSKQMRPWVGRARARAERAEAEAERLRLQLRASMPFTQAEVAVARVEAVRLTPSGADWPNKSWEPKERSRYLDGYEAGVRAAHAALRGDQP